MNGAFSMEQTAGVCLPSRNVDLTGSPVASKVSKIVECYLNVASNG